MIIFKYKAEPTGVKGQVIKRPVADVFLKAKTGEWIEFHPYIDSGADITLIPLSLGKLLGLKINEKKIQEIGGIRGNVPVIYSKIRMKIGGLELMVQTGWALIEEVPPLLGRTDVFDFFEVTFKQKEDMIIFDKSQ